MSFGFGVGDIADITKFAWKTYTALKSVSRDFQALESEVLSLSISLLSFDDDDTKDSIRRYTHGNAQRAKRFSDLLANSNAALKPLADLVEGYRSKDSEDKREVREWLNGAKFARKNLSVQDFRNKLAIHTASLNIFLSSLTHFSLGRLERLFIAEGATTGGVKEISASLRPEKSPFTIYEDGMDGTWSKIGLELIRGDMEAHDIARNLATHRNDIVNYVLFLLRGGRAFSKDELMKHETAEIVAIRSRSRLSEGLTFSTERRKSGGARNLMYLIDEMVLFDVVAARDDESAVVEDDDTDSVTEPYTARPPQSYPGKARASVSGSSPQPSPRIIMREPLNKTVYHYPHDMGRSASEGGSQPKAFKVPAVPMVRTTSAGPPSPKSPAASMNRRSSGTVHSPRSSSTSMAQTPSGGPSSPRLPLITQMTRVPSGQQSPRSPAIDMVRTASGNTFKPRSPSVSFAVPDFAPQVICDGALCGRHIVPHEVFFHCGRCAKKGFDVCGPCYEQGKRCPGRLADACPPMDRQVIGTLLR